MPQRMSPWLQHRWLEANAAEIVRYCYQHGSYETQERYGIKDYLTLCRLLAEHGFRTVPEVPASLPQVQRRLSAITRARAYLARKLLPPP